MNRAYYLCLDLGGTNLRICLFDKNQALLGEHNVIFPQLDYATDELDYCFNQVMLFLQANNIVKSNLCGIGLSCGASIEIISEKIISWPNRPHWKGIQLKQAFIGFFQTFVLIEDDTNAAAYAEFKYRESSIRTGNCIMINVGTGVGCGIILKGILFRGSHLLAGELGHITIDSEGPPCSCGKNGCLQTYVSGKFLQTNTNRQLELKGIKILGTAIANILMILDAECVIVGGGVVLHYPDFFPMLQRHIFFELRNRPEPWVNIVPCSLGSKSGLMGVLQLLIEMENVLNEPERLSL